MVRVLCLLLIVVTLLSACEKKPNVVWQPAGAVSHVLCPRDKPYQAGDNCYAKPFNVVYFSPGVALLGPQARISIERQAAWLNLFPNEKIRITGYADDLRSSEDSYVLGLQRAQAVKDYLLALDLDPDRIETASLGGRHLVAPHKGEKAKTYSRMAVSTMMHPKFPPLAQPDKN